MKRRAVIAAGLVGIGIAVAVGFGRVGISSAGSLAGESKLSCKLAGPRWVGTTLQQQRICFTVSTDGRKIRELVFSYRGTCANGGRITGTTQIRPSKIPVASDGSFAWTSSGSYFKGRLRGTTGSGRLHYKSSSYQVDPSGYGGSYVTCSSPTTRWTAHRVG